MNRKILAACLVLLAALGCAFLSACRRLHANCAGMNSPGIDQVEAKRLDVCRFDKEAIKRLDIRAARNGDAVDIPRMYADFADTADSGRIRAGPMKHVARPGFWLVEKFDEKAGWLEKHPTVAALRRDWGALLTDKVKDALHGKAEPATALDRKVTKDEIPELVRKGMEYLCGGTIEALVLTTVDGRTTAELVTTYALSRRQGATVKLVQKERLRTPRPTPPEISVADLEELINATATQIADRVVTGTVQDVMALRDAGSGK